MTCNIIEQLKSEGSLVLYHDYRSRSFEDWSGYGNHGVPTDTAWTGDGVRFPEVTSKITVPDSPELRLTEGTLVYLCDFYEQYNYMHMFAKTDAGGANYRAYFSGTVIALHNGAAVTSLAADVTGRKCAAISFDGMNPSEAFLDAGKVGELSPTIVFTADDAPLIIGGYYIPSVGFNMRNNTKAAVVINRKLTETEHAQLYGQLSNTTWPTKTYSISKAVLGVTPSESGLVAGYNMRPIGGKIIDLSEYGNDGTIDGAVYENTTLGDALRFDGVGDSVNCGTDPSLNVTSAMTFSCWIKAEDLSHPGGGNLPYILGKTQIVIAVNQLGRLNFITIGVSDTSSISPGGSIVTGLWHHIVCTYSQNLGTRRIYIDGQIAAEETGLTGAISTTSILYYGDNGASTRVWKGLLVEPRFYSDAKDQSWVTAEYQKGQTALRHSDWGANESVDAVTTGFIENTPFVQASGSFKVVADTLDGEVIKAVECITNGTLLFPAWLDGSDSNWTGWVDTGSGYVLTTLSLSSLVYTMLAGDKLAYADRSGNYSVTKEL